MKTYDEICKTHSIINKNKIRRLHRKYTLVINQYVKITFIEKNLNYKKIRKIFRLKSLKNRYFSKISHFQLFKNMKKYVLNEI